jgi:hypothetical protein
MERESHFQLRFGSDRKKQGERCRFAYGGESHLHENFAGK